MHKRAIIVASQKGGAGKTTWARGYLDILRAARKGVAAFDADGQVGQLLQFYGLREGGKIIPRQDPREGVGYFDIRDPRQRDQVLNGVELGADNLLIDLPGGSVHELTKILDEDDSASGLLDVMREGGYRPTIVLVITPMLAATKVVMESVRLFGPGADYVVVRNLAYGNPDDFVLFEGYTTADGAQRGGKGRKMIDECGGVVIDMPALSPRTYALIDQGNLTFSDAVNSGELMLADRSRASQWLRRFRESLEPAAGMLSLQASADAAA